MCKLKTNRGAAKRFKVRGSGSIKRKAAFRNHILTKKTQKSKRQKDVTHVVCAADVNSVERMLCIK